MRQFILSSCITLLAGNLCLSQPVKLATTAHQQAQKIESKVVDWRHDLHQYPELSNREFNTAAKVEAHLRALGLEVHTKIAHTGVVGVLQTGKPGPVIGLRADMDALPVTERVNLAWASKEVTTYNNMQTGVMHACGHDTHVAILMGVAEVLTQMKKDLKGTIVFIFQPAEEGAPAGEEGGASLMIKEGLIEKFKIETVFGLHINAQTPVGQVRYKPEGLMAASDQFSIKVTGSQAHGAYPWLGIDPIVASAQIINGLQTIVSRQSQLPKAAVVITVGSVHGGIRNNIIPETVEMIGTIRTLDTDMQDKVHEDIERTAIKIAESMNATAEVNIVRGNPVTYNHPGLTDKAAKWLANGAGAENVKLQDAVMGAEDFSYYAKAVPSFFFFIGGCPEGIDPIGTAPHHTPDFYVDDAGLITGMKSILSVTLGYMFDPLK